MSVLRLRPPCGSNPGEGVEGDTVAAAIGEKGGGPMSTDRPDHCIVCESEAVVPDGEKWKCRDCTHRWGFRDPSSSADTEESA